jgi:hypothetical protein
MRGFRTKGLFIFWPLAACATAGMRSAQHDFRRLHCEFRPHERVAVGRSHWVPNRQGRCGRFSRHPSACRLNLYHFGQRLKRRRRRSRYFRQRYCRQSLPASALRFAGSADTGRRGVTILMRASVGPHDGAKASRFSLASATSGCRPSGRAFCPIMLAARNAHATGQVVGRIRDAIRRVHLVRADVARLADISGRPWSDFDRRWLNRPGWPSSRGFDRPGYPDKPLVCHQVQPGNFLGGSFLHWRTATSGRIEKSRLALA